MTLEALPRNFIFEPQETNLYHHGNSTISKLLTQNQEKKNSLSIKDGETEIYKGQVTCPEPPRVLEPEREHTHNSVLLRPLRGGTGWWSEFQPTWLQATEPWKDILHFYGSSFVKGDVM